MKQEFKAIIQHERGRITIPLPYILADNIEKGDILKVIIEKVDIKKEV